MSSLVGSIVGKSADSSSWSFDDIPDLTGKTAIVTGGSEGIAEAVARHLLAHNLSRLYFLSRTRERADAAIQGWKDALTREDVDAAVRWVQCDLASLKQTDEVAKRLAGELDRLDIVCGIAATGFYNYRETEDGIDNHHQVNVLSHQLLITRLFPLLCKTAQTHSVDVRVVMASSLSHDQNAPPEVHYASLEELNTDLGPMQLYGRSKLGALLLAKQLHKRFVSPTSSAPDLDAYGISSLGGERSRVYVNAIHPGTIATDQEPAAGEAYKKELNPVLGKAAQLAFKAAHRVFRSTDTGSITTLWCATSEDIVKQDLRGAYVVPGVKVQTPSKMGQDEALGDAMWELNEKLLREKLGQWP